MNDRFTHALRRTLSGYEDRVLAVTVLDHQYVVSASADRTLKVWNLQTDAVLASIDLDGALQCVAVARQAARMLVVAGDAGGALYCLELIEPKN